MSVQKTIWMLVIAGFLPFPFGALLYQEPVYADTTADCGRFYLKRNPKTNRMECVNKKKSAGVSVGGIRRQQAVVKRILLQAGAIAEQKDLTDDERRRVKALLTEANQRVRDIQQQTAELRQEQKTRMQSLSSEQDRRSRQQNEAARALEQQQQELTRQLITQQRQLLNSLKGGS